MPTKHDGRIDAHERDQSNRSAAPRVARRAVALKQPALAYLLAAARDANKALRAHCASCSTCRSVDLDNCGPESFCTRGSAIYVAAFDIEVAAADEAEATRVALELATAWTCPNGQRNRGKDRICWDAPCACRAARPTVSLPGGPDGPVDVSWIHEYGLSQKLSKQVRVF